jgi:hypothetical protein
MSKCSWELEKLAVLAKNVIISIDYFVIFAKKFAKMEMFRRFLRDFVKIEEFSGKFVKLSRK